MRPSHVLWAPLAWLALTPAAWSQPVPSGDPSSTHIFPAGGRRGSVVAVRVGSECLPPGADFHIWGGGVSAPKVLGPEAEPRGEPSLRRDPTELAISYPREWTSEIVIDAKAEPGPRWWRLSCARGGTRVRPFLVGDLPEFIETEPNSTPQRAECVSLPVTLNGQVSGERDLDFYRFAAKSGDVVVAEVFAGRIGSPIDPIVEVRTTDGRRLEVEETYVADDPVVAFRVPKDDEYLLLVANLGFHGDPSHVYRINLSAAPYVFAAFPFGGRAGQTRDVEFAALSGTGTAQFFRETVRFAESQPGVFLYRGHSPGVNPLPMIVDKPAEVVEAEGNNALGAAEPLTPPMTVDGRFLAAADEDWYRFRVKRGESSTIECRPFPPGSAASPVVTLHDARGALLTQARSIESPRHTARIERRAAEDGELLVRVHDMQQGVRGGPGMVYRLSVRPTQPDYSLSLATDCVGVVQGGRVEVELLVERTGGFDGPIGLKVEGLPKGVRAEPKEIAQGQEHVKLALIADEGVSPGDGTIRLVGTARIGGEPRERPARVPCVGLEADADSPDFAPNDRLALTVQPKPLFRLSCLETYQYAHRGTVYPYTMRLERLHGFEGEVVLQIGDRQNRDLDGIECVETVVPPGVTEVKLPIYLPETMHINVQSQSQVYAQGYARFRDAEGREQSWLTLSEKRNMIRTLPTVVKLRAAAEALTARAGAEVPCALRLDRTPNFTGGMEVTLVEPRSGSGVTALPAKIEAGATDASIVVRLGSELTPDSGHTLRFRAVGKMDGGVTVVSETTVPLNILPREGSP